MTKTTKMLTVKSRRHAGKLSKAFKSFDFFGEGISFEIEGESTHRTCLGALCSIAIIIVTLSYAASRFDVMLNYGDSVH